MYSLADVLAIVWSLWALALLTTIARIILRWRIQKKFHEEDYFAFLSFFLLSALVGVVVTVTPKFDRTRQYLLAAAKDPLHTPLPLPIEEFTAQNILSLKLMFAQMLLFWSTLWAGKFSLLVFFRKMVLGLPQYMRIWWFVFTMVLLTYLACMLSNFLTCTPLKKYWSATGCSAPEDLKRSDASIKFATAADIFADFLIMLLPLRLLLTLQMSLKQKAGLASLFSMGTIVVVFAFIRFYNVTKATANVKLDPTTLVDSPIILSLWSTIEAAVGTIVANLPAFRSLLTNRGQTRNTTTKQSGNEGYPRSGTFGGSRKNNSRSAIIERETELESLHSFEGVDARKGRTKQRKENAGEIVMTRHISVENRKRMKGEEDSLGSKLGLTL